MINITIKMNNKSDISMSLPKKFNELMDLINQYDLEDEQVLIQNISSDNVPELWRLKNKVVNLYEFNYFSTLVELLPQGELQKLNAVLYDTSYNNVKKMINDVFYLFGYMLSDEGRLTPYGGINAITYIPKTFGADKPMLGVHIISSVEMNAYVTLPTTETYIQSIISQTIMDDQNYRLDVYPLDINDNLWNCIKHLKFDNIFDLYTFVNMVKMLKIDDKHFDNLKLVCSVLEAYPLKKIKDTIRLLNCLDEFELTANNSEESYALEHIEKMFRDIKRNKFSLDEINELQDLLGSFISYKPLGEYLLEGYVLQEVTLGYLKYPKDLCIQENDERSEFDHELSLS